LAEFIRGFRCEYLRKKFSGARVSGTGVIKDPNPTGTLFPDPGNLPKATDQVFRGRQVVEGKHTTDYTYSFWNTLAEIGHITHLQLDSPPQASSLQTTIPCHHHNFRQIQADNSYIRPTSSQVDQVLA
jgi:hypothetical protein